MHTFLLNIRDPHAPFADRAVDLCASSCIHYCNKVANMLSYNKIKLALGSHGLVNRWFVCTLLTISLIWICTIANDSETLHVVAASTRNIIKQSYSSHTHSSVPDIVEVNPSSNEPAIPRRIWHILFPNGDTVTDQQISFVADWIKKAPGYTYTFLGATGGSAIVSRYYGASSEELHVFEQLTNPALKSDFLRYLILAAEGGYYGDIDTRPVVPLEEWLEPDLRSKVRLLIAPEEDDFINQDSTKKGHVQFGQWSIAAAPGHPVLRNMVAKCLSRLHELAEDESTTLDKLHPTNIEVLNTTGPYQWTNVIWDYLYEVGEADGVTKKEDLGGLQRPRLVSDVLVLPVPSFRAPTPVEIPFFDGQAGDRRLLEHHMMGTWRAWNPQGA